MLDGVRWFDLAVVGASTHSDVVLAIVHVGPVGAAVVAPRSTGGLALE